MRSVVLVSLGTLLASAPVLPMLHAHESPGHRSSSGANASRMQLGTEIYAGRDGYIHAGAAASARINDKSTLVLGTHLVREENGATEIPSFEAEFIYEAESWEIETFGFGYPHVEQKEAWGLGVRVSRKINLDDEIRLSPFLGPTYARVKAIDEATEGAVGINHLMLLGGATLDVGKFSLTLLGSYSFYDRDADGLETPVDIESMTHFAAYENNDGLVRATAATELSYQLTQRFTFNVRYAAMWFDSELRHAIAITPSIRVTEHLELTAGVQMLRGGENINDLMFVGCSLEF